MSAIPRKFFPPVAIAVALAFLYFTVIVKLGNDWWHDENYSHGLLIPFVIAFILWQERKSFVDSKSAPATWLGAIGIGAALCALWAGTAGVELFVQTSLAGADARLRCHLFLWPAPHAGRRGALSVAGSFDPDTADHFQPHRVSFAALRLALRRGRDVVL